MCIDEEAHEDAIGNVEKVEIIITKSDGATYIACLIDGEDWGDDCVIEAPLSVVLKMIVGMIRIAQTDWTNIIHAHNIPEDDDGSRH